MKLYFTPMCIAVIAVLLAFTSCNRSATTQPDLTLPSGIEKHRAYLKNQLSFHTELFMDLLLSTQRETQGLRSAPTVGLSPINQNDFVSYVEQNLYQHSLMYLTLNDINEEIVSIAYGVHKKPEELEEIDLIGLALFVNAVESYADLLEPTSEYRGNLALACAAEVLLISEGAKLLKGLGTKTITKAAFKQIAKLAAKIGGRTIGGIGLALVVAEFTYCMVRERNYTCELTVPYPSKQITLYNKYGIMYSDYNRIRLNIMAYLENQKIETP